MTIFTNRYSITRTGRPTPSSIDLRCHRFQMSRVDATSVVAKVPAHTREVGVVASMVQYQVIGNGADNSFVDYAVNQLESALYMDSAVPVSCCERPQPTGFGITRSDHCFDPLQRLSIRSARDKSMRQRSPVHLPTGIVHRAPSPRLVSLIAALNRAGTRFLSAWNESQGWITVTHPTLVVHFAPTTNGHRFFAAFNGARWQGKWITLRYIGSSYLGIGQSGAVCAVPAPSILPDRGRR